MTDLISEATINNKIIRYYILKGAKLAFKRHGVNGAIAKRALEEKVHKVRDIIQMNPELLDKIKDYSYRVGRNMAIDNIKGKRRYLNESPLADYGEPKVLSKKYWDEKISPRDYYKNNDVEKSKKILSNPTFKGKLTKLLQNFPIDVYVYPVISEKFNRNSSNDMKPDGYSVTRTNLLMIDDYHKYSRLSDEENKKIIDVANQTFGKEALSTIIVPIVRGTKDFELITPWMIFHAMFDDQGLIANERVIQVFREDINSLVQTLLSMAKDVDKTPQDIEIEKLFTFGSARGNIFKKYPILNGDFGNEALTQCLTTKGFIYNKEYLNNLQKILGERLTINLNWIKQNLDKLEKMSEQVKYTVINRIKNRIVTVQVSRLIGDSVVDNKTGRLISYDPQQDINRISDDDEDDAVIDPDDFDDIDDFDDYDDEEELRESMQYKISNFNYNENKQKLLNNLLEHLVKEWNINKPFTIDFIDDKLNEENDLAKTGAYNPQNSSIVVYSTGRHYKDILRTVAHEVYHHKQFCEGKLDKLLESDLDQKSIYDDIEEDAYRFGNKTFRMWEDQYKSGDKQKMNLENVQHEILKRVEEALIKEASEKDTPTRSTGINKLITALKVVLPTVESAYKSLTTDKAQRISFKKSYLMALLATLAPQNVIGKYSGGDDVSAIKLSERIIVKGINSVADTAAASESEPIDLNIEDIGGQKFVKDPSKIIDPNDPDGEKKKKEDAKASAKGQKDEEAEKLMSVDGEEVPFPEEEGLDPTGRFEAVEVYKKTIDAVTRSFRRLGNAKDKTDFQNELITQLLLWFDKWEYDISPDVPDLSTDEYEQSKGQVQNFQSSESSLAEEKASVKHLSKDSFEQEILEALIKAKVL